MLFITPTKRRYRLVVRPNKTDRDGQITQEPIYCSFEDGVFETNDEDIINFIRSRVNFGADFFEVTEIPKTHGYQGNKVGIVKMDRPETNKQDNLEVNSLRNEVNELKKVIQDMALSLKTVPTSVQSTDTDENEDEDKKLDKRSKEYKELMKNK